MNYFIQIDHKIDHKIIFYLFRELLNGNFYRVQRFLYEFTGSNESMGLASDMNSILVENIIYLKCRNEIVKIEKLLGVWKWKNII